ncbi:hypothetical protein OC846_006213 [Tilletia horrida]|uniref:CBS domain-containing protein n=1 Tax=Tilletia horrida TaxID=155126 RepID=A0AAN6JV86_9BASI|nr:hypothetical protein OC845_006216 [Tilletia horrida]KAK0543992.1 hypothetical protein OC846_006213 [Tilletia horrida]KAK0560238.1 hypothetical protein OC861_006346 [Tilletia horrida]
MTPIDQVFMLPLSAKLDYPTLERIVRSGHSRIPIYQEYDVPVAAPSGTATPSKRPSLLSSIARKATLTGSRSGSASDLHANKAGAVNSPKLGAADDKDANSANPNTETVKRKKILGTLLVKSCVLLDPEDATPISDMVINAIPTVPGNEPLLNVLNVFQEGRSHMAIVSSAHSRLADMQNRSASMNVSSKALGINAGPRTDGLSDIDEEKQLETTSSKDDAETAIGDAKEKEQEYDESFVGPDAPIGIITLEDVLEELIGEEIWDEYDTVEGRQADFARLSPPPSPDQRLRDPNDLQPIMGSEKEAMLHNHPDQNKTQHAKTVDVAAGSDSKAAATADAPGVPGSDSGNTSSASGNAAVPARAATDIPAISTQQASAPASKPMGAVRPVVVRSTTGTGQTSTATALLPENLLRGRRMGPGGTTTQPLPPGSVVQLAPPRLPSNSGTAGAGGLLNAPGTVLGSGSASAVGTPLLGGASPLLGGSSLMSTTSGPPSGGADTSLGGGAANTTASSGTNSAAAGPGSVSTTPVIGPARANRFKSTPVPRINAVRSRSIGPGPPAAVPTSTGATDPSAQAAVPGAAFLVASPPAIESETSPLDASIASLASLGGGPRDSSGNAQDNEGSDTTR